ncbi:TPA: hypothetical protein DEO28_04880 [Candidatus Dependentiae bacterium]|nr:MAG: Peptidase M16 domain protein [candidate division TM6 bacterium GW2011_GWE2_31_21]KKP53886.1 MAG: Peptidase M16 domain protein [candidate division TM6 bacterium GW2011_GWF2_33_332]HBS47666.1 hypothetical protein [Candidatus Dependentiae bacterium]HBZ73815.1 hypothetical protein [Candidatus Dependentiae bacterium]
MFLRNKLVFTTTVFLILLTVLIFKSVSCHRKENLNYWHTKTQRSTPINIPTDKITKVVLENGMTILVFENKAIPKVLVQIAYDIGSAVEQPNERGLAHLIEHMIFKGTDKLSEGDIDGIARKYGATLNAFTSKDVTSYYFEVNSNNWKFFVPILADCMVNARFDSQHLASELKTVISELKMYQDDYVRLGVDIAEAQIFPSNHPYHFPIIGFKDSLLNLNSENLKKFYKKYYQPNHATLFIMGDVDTKEAIALAKANFENIKVTSSYLQDALPFVPQIPTITNTTIFKQVEKPIIGYYFTVPGLKEKQYLEQQALEFILGSGDGSRLYRKLVDEEKIATSVSVASDVLMNTSVLFIFIEPISGKEEQCKKLVTSELNKLIQKGVSDEELEKVRNVTRLAFFETIQNPGHFVSEWIYSYFATGDELNIFKDINNLLNLKSQNLQDYAANYLAPDSMSEIKINPLPKHLEDKALLDSQKEDNLDLAILGKHNRTTTLEEARFIKNMPPANPLEFQYPKPDKTFTLENGLKVILLQKKQWPFVALNLKFKDASYFAAAKEGTALGLAMDMLIEESSNLSKKEIVDFFERNGAAYSFDETGVSVNTLKETYPQIFKHLMHVIENPTFPSKSFDKLKTNLLEDFARNQDDPKYIASRISRKIAYKNHPFGWDLKEMEKYLKDLSLKNIKTFYSQHVSPSHLILTIVGDFDSAEMENNIKNTFGNWKGDKYQEPQMPKYSPIDVENVDHFMLRNQIVLIFGRRSDVDVYNDDYIPLQLVNLICFSSLGSRLYQLREETGWFYRASGGIASGSNKYLGVDFIYAILSLDTLEKAEDSMLNLIKSISNSKKITQDELEVAKQLYLKGLIDSSATYNNLATKFYVLDSLNLGFDYYDKVLKRINSITVDEINTIASKYLKTENLSRIRVGRIGKKDSK